MPTLASVATSFYAPRGGPSSTFASPSSTGQRSVMDSPCRVRSRPRSDLAMVSISNRHSSAGGVGETLSASRHRQLGREHVAGLGGGRLPPPRDREAALGIAPDPLLQPVPPLRHRAGDLDAALPALHAERAALASPREDRPEVPPHVVLEADTPRQDAVHEERPIVVVERRPHVETDACLEVMNARRATVGGFRTPRAVRRTVVVRLATGG